MACTYLTWSVVRCRCASGLARNLLRDNPHGNSLGPPDVPRPPAPAMCDLMHRGSATRANRHERLATGGAVMGTRSRRSAMVLLAGLAALGVTPATAVAASAASASTATRLTAAAGTADAKFGTSVWIEG